MPKHFFGVFTALCLAAGSLSANEISDGDIVILNVSKETVLRFEQVKWPGNVGGITIRIVGPLNPQKREDPQIDTLLETGDELPAIDLAKLGEITDGFYGFEITGSTGEKVEIKEPLNDGRNRPATAEFVPFRLAGKILIDGRRIIQFEQFEEKETDGGPPGEEIDDSDEGKSKGTNPGSGREVKEERVNDSDKG